VGTTPAATGTRKHCRWNVRMIASRATVHSPLRLWASRWERSGQGLGASASLADCRVLAVRAIGQQGNKFGVDRPKMQSDPRFLASSQASDNWTLSLAGAKQRNDWRSRRLFGCAPGGTSPGWRPPPGARVSFRAFSARAGAGMWVATLPARTPAERCRGRAGFDCFDRRGRPRCWGS
jgi:hypothetical protein